MIILLRMLAGVFAVLNSEESPRGLAAGFAYGVMLGLVPLGFLATVLGLFAFLININLAMMGIAALVFKVVAYLLDPVANKIGYALLVKTPALHAFWTRLYNMPVIPYTRFNNTIVLGSLVLGVVLLVPMYLIGMKFVAMYRSSIREKILKWKIVQWLDRSKFVQYYRTYRRVSGQ
jgi:uncharacterized protein (TIGR03546 family)